MFLKLVIFVWIYLYLICPPETNWASPRHLHQMNKENSGTQSFYMQQELCSFSWCGLGMWGENPIPAVSHLTINPWKGLWSGGEFSYHEQNKDIVNTHLLLIFFNPCEERGGCIFCKLIIKSFEVMKLVFGCMSVEDFCQSSLQGSSYGTCQPDKENHLGFGVLCVTGK